MPTATLEVPDDVEDEDAPRLETTVIGDTSVVGVPKLEQPPEKERFVQRRIHYRQNTDMFARIHVPWEVTVQLVDISIAGARFDRQLPCSPDIPIQFVIEVPALGDVPVVGTVVWMKDGHCGIKFDTILGQKGKALEAELLEQERKHLATRAHPTKVPGAPDDGSDAPGEEPAAS
jgi:PilZ domain